MLFIDRRHITRGNIYYGPLWAFCIPHDYPTVVFSFYSLNLWESKEGVTDGVLPITSECLNYNARTEVRPYPSRRPALNYSDLYG